jgi:hypothetical protein
MIDDFDPYSGGPYDEGSISPSLNEILVVLGGCVVLAIVLIAVFG